MAKLSAYLNFDGNTEEVFNFYKSVFGGEFTSFQRFSDAPGMDHVSESDKQKVMHVSLPVGNTSLMGSDTVESFGHKFQAGNNFSLTISPDSEADAERLFSALSEGGEVTMPLEKTFWNAYFGMLTDKYGIRWMIDYEL